MTRRMPHPLAGGTFRNWVRTVWRYGRRQTRWGRILKCGALSAAAAPFRAYEQLRWNRSLRQVPVREPIFICGHWQSGHSLVQLLLACDPRIATLRLRHAVQPAACLTLQPLLRRFLAPRLSDTRIADDLPHGLDAPQGDDLALGQLTLLSIYDAWYFPSRAIEVFRRSVLMEGVPATELADWQRHYRRLLQKVLWESGRERVALRNAGNTARIPFLLAEFPDARFVFCHRDPYEVFAASVDRWSRLTEQFSLETDTLAAEEIESLTLSWYEELLQRYLADRAHVPAGRIVEIGYAELRERPVAVMQRVYDTFGLTGFAEVRPTMERLPREQVWELAGHRPLTTQQRAMVARRWAFAFREWGYAL